MVGSFYEGWDQISGAMSTGLGVAVSAFASVWEWLSQLQRSLREISPLFMGITEVWGYMRDFAASTFTTLAAVFRNWGAIVADTGIRINQFGTDFMAVCSWLGKSAMSFGSWFIANFPALFHDAFANALTLAKNLATNVWGLIQEIFNWMKSGFTADFDVSKFNLVKGATNGMVRTSAPLPDFGGPNIDHTESEKARAKLWDGIAEKEANRLANIAKKVSGDVKTDKEETAEADDRIVQLGIDHFDPSGGRRNRKKGGLAGKGADIREGEGDGKVEILRLIDLKNKAQEAVGGGKEKEKAADKMQKTQEDQLATQKAIQQLLGQPRAAVLR